MSRRLLIALGGNALKNRDQKGNIEQYTRNIQETCATIVAIIENGYKVAITHGNGPQVGVISAQNALSRDKHPPMPLHVCGAKSQGMIGYMIQQSLKNEMQKAGTSLPVVTLITQTIVDKDDEAFKEPPIKGIGDIYDAPEAKRLEKELGWIMEPIDKHKKKYRRKVHSPEPKAIVEENLIKALYDSGSIPIACGGGGVPVVVKDDGSLEGVEAVIDKDLTAQIFASLICADTFLILTNVEKVALNYGASDQIDLDEMTVDEVRKYQREGHFGRERGDMYPKVEAAARFVEAGGEKAIISSIGRGRQALYGRAGTVIHR